MSNEVAVADEIDGALLRLCSTSCTDEKLLKQSRDALKRAALRVRDGESEYPAVISAILARLSVFCERDDWHVKYRLLGVIPLFVKKAEVPVVVATAKCLQSESWMVRQQAFESLCHLMSRDISTVHLASQPGTQTNSRPISSHKLREPAFPNHPRPLRGLVIGEKATESASASKLTASTLQPIANRAGINDDAEAKAPSIVQDDMHFEIAAKELLETILLLLKNAEMDIRRLAISCLGKCFRAGDDVAVKAAMKAANDSAWQCRAAALLSLREIAITGDVNVQSTVVGALEDQRYEVREAAIKALETSVHKGDRDVEQSIFSFFEKAHSWSAKFMGCKAWHLIETACKALGVIAESEDESAVYILKLMLESDQQIEVQRAATYALGCIAERTAPEDMVWTYHNATAQPSRLSTWSNKRWNSKEQDYVPNLKAAPIDAKFKHSPREVLQAVTRTPRGGVLPHLLTTPRNEHLYEPGDEVDEALNLREKLRKQVEKEERVQDLVLQIDRCMASKDFEEVVRLKSLLQAAMRPEGDGPVNARNFRDSRLFARSSLHLKRAVPQPKKSKELFKLGKVSSFTAHLP